ncbi:hypothetical protein [Alicycliphilus denitrificans]|uniref:hypothetical protein n=1 Tax=Alicycliphilus denitrificans TaxID=179636 RepID=UPI0001DA0DF0|nr:hypothetical protein [Alicycliphilus denitrificans]ADV01292.1 hypothetical protein Alide_3575 [Alicycliphilus denitrificans BC]
MPATQQALPAIGTHLPAHGGTLGAYFALPDGSLRALIYAGREHEFNGAWGLYGKDVADARGIDGMASTVAMAVAGSDTAKAMRALTINGHNDWFIGSRVQMILLSENVPEDFDKDALYLTSTQYSAYFAWCQDFELGYSHTNGEDYEFRAVPLRCIQLQELQPSALPGEAGIAAVAEASAA